MARRRRQQQQRLQLALFPDEAFVAPRVVAVPPAAPVRLGSPAVPTQPAMSRTGPRGLSSADARRLVWLRTQGESVAALAAQFHTSRQVVQRYLREPGRIRALEAQEAQGRRPDTCP